MGVTGLETAFAVLHTELVLPGRARARPAGRADERRRGRLRARACPAWPPGAEANVALFDPAAEWEAGAEGWESRSAQLLLRRPDAARPGADDRGRRAGSPTASAASRWGSHERARSSTRRGPRWSSSTSRRASARRSPSFDQVAAGHRGAGRGGEAIGIPIVRHRAVPEGPRADRPRGRRASPRGPEPIEKVCFSAPEAEGFDLAGRDQALVCGIETHVCVNQTALDLLDAGVEVHVVRDAVGSRTAENREIGLQRPSAPGR